MKVQRGPWTFELGTSRPMTTHTGEEILDDTRPRYDGSVVVHVSGRVIAIAVSPDEAERLADILVEYAHAARVRSGKPVE